MEKITLETESYLINKKGTERYFPFLEMEYNENVIYENDIPKYFLTFSEDLKSAHEVGNWIMAELEKNGHNLRELIIELGNSLNLKWDIFSSNVGNFVEDSWKTETIELIRFSDNLIEKIKTTPQQRV
ncbi:hypothetical protein [Winogradskyella helgolandensis]|uniref:hypothetical protein n=1 Tax=Winogradskyella helgolandensis TaxID=2697010 RepID=UPI0015BAB19C|nr:hypothetical protein [Winogradskyella helgolandensis]